MDNTLSINTGTAYLFNERSEIFNDYKSADINAGNVIISRKVYDKITKMGVSINSGSTQIIDIDGEIVELSENTVITAAHSYSGCFLVCDGNLIIEDAKGLDGITGLFAKCLFHAEAVNISSVRGISATTRIVYPDGARLRFGNIQFGEDSHFVFEDNALYWVHGAIRALDGEALEKLCRKKTSFHSKKLIIYAGLYEKYSDLFQADKYIFITDGYGVADEITLSSATSLLYGDKLYVLGNLTVQHDQIEHLKGFSSLIVNGTATLPVSAAADFKSVGKANNYDLYEGVIMPINGFQTLGHEQLQSAIKRGISYTLKVNGTLYFFNDVTEDDMSAIAAVYCNGLISAPDRARSVLDSKIKGINGTIIDIDAMIKKLYGEDFSYGSDPIGFIKKAISQAQDDESGNSINCGTFKL